MTDFERSTVARLAAMEVLQVSAIGLLFAMTGNDPRWEKMKAMLEQIQRTAAGAWAHLPDPVGKEATALLSDLCNQVAEAAVAYRSTDRMQ